MASDSEKFQPTMDKYPVDPVDIARQVLIWQWVLDPKGKNTPTDLTKEELVGVYYQNRKILSSFTEALNRVGQVQTDVKLS
jgi:hypothetical protein